jgi:hypothetical protein
MSGGLKGDDACLEVSKDEKIGSESKGTGTLDGASPELAPMSGLAFRITLTRLGEMRLQEWPPHPRLKHPAREEGSRRFSE